MRFFALVSCCAAPAEQSAVPATTPRTEEKLALVSLSCAEGDPCPREKRRGRGSLAWRPSLVSISEDSVAVVGPTRRCERAVGSAKGSVGKHGSAAKINVREGRDRFGHPTTPVVLPAFSPTAFLF